MHAKHYRDDVQALLRDNPLFVYQSAVHVESIEFFYKICRGAQRSSRGKNVEFIYPGMDMQNGHRYLHLRGVASNQKSRLLQARNGVDRVMSRKITRTSAFIGKKTFVAENTIIVPGFWRPVSVI